MTLEYSFGMEIFAATDFRLMLRYNVGCRDEEILHLKKVDEDFFEA